MSTGLHALFYVLIEVCDFGIAIDMQSTAVATFTKSSSGPCLSYSDSSAFKLQPAELYMTHQALTLKLTSRVDCSSVWVSLTAT